MNILKITLTVLFAFFSLTSIASEALYKTNCASCHSQIGSAGLAPVLFGQEPGYIIKSLNAFRDGSRKDHILNTMNVIAKNLTDEQIKSLAAYVAGQDSCSVDLPVDTNQRDFKTQFMAGRDLAQNSSCMHCHASYHHGAPRLNGQNTRYLQRTLSAFKNGQRKDPYMERVINHFKFTDEDLNSLSVYFGGMRLMRQCH